MHLSLIHILLEYANIRLAAKSDIGILHQIPADPQQREMCIRDRSYIRNKLLASKLVLSYPLFGGNLSVGGEYTDTRRNDEYLSLIHISSLLLFDYR